MSEEPGAHTHDPGLGIRHGDERRHAHSRRRTRIVPDRRRRDRRRRRVRTFLLAAATVAAAPAQAKLKQPRPTVSVSMNNFQALSPEKAYESLIQEAADAYGLDPNLIRAVMRTESAFNPLVVSPIGAQGLMQLMPDVAEELGVTDPFDPRQNIMGGAKYLRQLLDIHHGNVPLTLASYNAGPGNVARYKAIPPFPETRRYVKTITGLMADAKNTADSD